jgi:hypothetical protein
MCRNYLSFPHCYYLRKWQVVYSISSPTIANGQTLVPPPVPNPTPTVQQLRLKRRDRGSCHRIDSRHIVNHVVNIHYKSWLLFLYGEILG